MPLQWAVLVDPSPWQELRPQSPFPPQKAQGGNSDHQRGGVSNPAHLTPGMLPCYCLTCSADLAPAEDASLKDEELQAMYLNSTISEVPTYIPHYGGWVMMVGGDCVLACSSGALAPGCCFTSKQRR